MRWLQLAVSKLCEKIAFHFQLSETYFSQWNDWKPWKTFSQALDFQIVSRAFLGASNKITPTSDPQSLPPSFQCDVTQKSVWLCQELKESQCLCVCQVLVCLALTMSPMQMAIRLLKDIISFLKTFFFLCYLEGIYNKNVSRYPASLQYHQSSSLDIMCQWLCFHCKVISLCTSSSRQSILSSVLPTTE